VTAGGSELLTVNVKVEPWDVVRTTYVQRVRKGKAALGVAEGVSTVQYLHTYARSSK